MSTLIKTEGIVLNHHFYGESSAIVHIYTRALGRQSYVVNSIRGQRKNKKTQLLQPLNRLSMEVYHSPKKDLHRIRDFMLIHPLMHIPFSQSTRAQAFFITEVLTKVLTMQDPAPETYDFLNTAIELLDSNGEGAENLHLFILFRLTRLLGFQPTNNHSPQHIWFDLKNGYFTSTEPSHPFFLNPVKTALFLRFFQTEASSLPQLARSATERETQMKALLDFYRLHAPGLETLHSLEVLHQTLRPGQS